MDSARRNLLILTGTLLGIGLVMVYSSSFVYADNSRFGSPTYFLERHCIYLLAGCIALVVGSLWDYHLLARHWRLLLGVSFAALLLVFIPGFGMKINGARRWVGSGGLTFQPSELAKPLMIVALSAWAVSRREKIKTFKEGFLPAALLAGSAAGLTAIEPDLGNAALLTTALCAILFVAGVRAKHAVPALACLLPLVALCAWSKLGYVQSRWNEFMSSKPDPLGHGYQIHQALIAQGSGGVFGTGLGQGHAKLLFLPEAHNDFILAPIGEELGLIGAWLVLLCFALFVWQGWQVARNAPDMLGALIAMGLTLMIGMQAAINAAVVSRSMPTKGISLPLVSYGGSSLVFTLFAVGILLNVAAHRGVRSDQNRQNARKVEAFPNDQGAVPEHAVQAA